ncbi:MAG: hypothetical protein EB084_02085 [Proteobacteria bacterium]|nr:hypothetical protein [Pseudomonadota bacterium]
MTVGFPVDQAVMSRIHRMRVPHALEVAALHHADMGNSLWARLGRRFLETLYRALLESRWFLGFVYIEDGRLGGFVAATTNGRRMFADVLRRRAIPLLLRAAQGVMRDPSILLPLLSTPFYFLRSRARPSEAEATRANHPPDAAPALADAADRDGTESLFCSFMPELRGRRISGHINKVLFDELAWRGHATVKVTTEVDNEGAVRQLTHWGFRRCRSFRFYEKDMWVFVLDLRASPRVEAQRHPCADSGPGEETSPGR